MSSAAPRKNRGRGPQRPKGAEVTTSASAGAKAHGWRRNETTGNESEDDGNHCLICANPIEIAAYSACNHTTCHKCTFRQRALYQKKACLVCRTENPLLVFSEDPLKAFDSFGQKDFVHHNERYGIDFTSHYARDATLGLLEFGCPQCGEQFPSFKKLNAHVKEAHQLEYCHLCGTQKKAFLSELKLYTRHQLQKHLSAGDESGFKGHPACAFCSGMRFYSEDEWNDHMKKSHERCHICDKLDPRNPQYFKNYDSVWNHFESQHFTCAVGSCREAKFVVFQDEFELQLHMSKEHPSLIGSSFALNGTSRGFRSGLSTYQASPPSSGSSSRAPSRAAARGPPEEVVDLHEIKQRRLEERARHYLNYATSGFETFTKTNAEFKKGELTTAQLVKTYKELFVAEQSDIGLLLKELAELYAHSSPKRAALLSAMNELTKHQQHQEQFPALAGAENGLFSESASWRNRPALSSSAQAAFPPLGSASGSRPPPVKPVVGRSTKHFPALTGGTRPAPSIFAPTPVPQVNYKTVIKKGNGYVKPMINTSQASASYKPNYLTTRPKLHSPSPSTTPILSVGGLNLGVLTKKTGLNDNLFPSLPVSTKKPIPRVNPIVNTSAGWGKKVTPQPTPAPVPEPVERKKKGKKQVLYHIGL